MTSKMVNPEGKHTSLRLSRSSWMILPTHQPIARSQTITAATSSTTAVLPVETVTGPSALHRLVQPSPDTFRAQAFSRTTSRPETAVLSFQATHQLAAQLVTTTLALTIPVTNSLESVMILSFLAQHSWRKQTKSTREMKSEETGSVVKERDAAANDIVGKGASKESVRFWSGYRTLDLGVITGKGASKESGRPWYRYHALDVAACHWESRQVE